MKIPRNPFTPPFKDLRLRLSSGKEADFGTIIDSHGRAVIGGVFIDERDWLVWALNRASLFPVPRKKH